MNPDSGIRVILLERALEVTWEAVRTKLELEYRLCRMLEMPGKWEVCPGEDTAGD